MDDTFRQREKSYEAKFKLDDEARFKARCRRNKLLGRWAAERMGMPRTAVEAYAGEVVSVDLDGPGVAHVVGKVLEDFRARNIEIGEPEIRDEMTRFHTLAMEQIAREYPEPLGPDHERVGD